jgi:arabinofuranan 3-O-arabinosyltransferase
MDAASVSRALKAAALAAGTLVVTPHVYMYDLVVLAVGFLLRFALERGFGATQTVGLSCAGVLIIWPSPM